MKVHTTELPGVLLVEPTVHRDARGFFFESYRADRYAQAGIDTVFVQDNHSLSQVGTLRGLHAQVAPHAQAKLVRVIEGEIFDVAVDVRLGSPSFGRFASAVLSAENHLQLYVPTGFAHGFCVTSARAQVEYKCSAPYDPSCELAIAWDDPALAIPWPVRDPVLSARDRAAPRLAEAKARLPRFDGGGA